MDVNIMLDNRITITTKCTGVMVDLKKLNKYFC